MKVIPKDQLIVRQSMRLPFRGSEIWGIELDSLSVHTDLVTEKLRSDMAVAKRPSTPSAVAIHLQNTRITEALAQTIAAELFAAGNAVRKVAFIGLDAAARRLVQKKLRAQPCACIWTYINDYEKAKEWLIP